MSYFKELQKSKEAVQKILASKGVDPRHLSFGGAGSEPEKKPRAPTDARSEFLANRAMGDWAENLLAAGLRTTLTSHNIAHYGNADSISAGHEDFKEVYLGGLEEVRQYGKRPDLLIFPKAVSVPDSISEMHFSRLDPLAKQAAASIEVRSSKFEALKYMAVRQQQRAAGSAPSRDTPSFTVKVEDLVIVYRWLERMKLPQAYFQVFFDSVFAINILDIFKLIGDWQKGLVIETPAKSQQKATIMIPITLGAQVGTLSELPEFTVEHRVTNLGRHDAFVKPIGGKLTLNPEKISRVLFS